MVTYSSAISSAVFYGVCSTSMAFINKAVVSSYQFDVPFFIMTCQMAVSIAALELCRTFQCINLSNFTVASGISFFWPSFFYAAHSITALYALSGMSIPMYAAIKRCTPLVTLILSVMFLHKSPPRVETMVSVLLITIGCLLAGFGDLQFDIATYAYGAISVVVQGLYFTLIQKSSEDLSALKILHINSYNAFPVFFIICLILEVGRIAEFRNISDVGFLLCFSVQLCMGVLLNFSLLLCTANNSALTTSVVGVMKSMFQSVVGSFSFGGIVFNSLNVIGIALNTFGGVLYIVVKYKEKQTEHSVTCAMSKSDNIV